VGATGPAGPAGDIAALDWPFIEKTNWPQGATLLVADALARLGKVELFLSSPLHARTLEAQPKVVQVWFEPSTPQTTGALVPGPLMALHGDIKLAEREIVWAANDERERLQATLGVTGRVMLRVHCGHLVDEKERSFSSSLDGLVGVRSPRVPAGVFEAWFFVVREGTIRPNRSPGSELERKPDPPARKRSGRGQNP
jgi:hypothetical protein